MLLRRRRPPDGPRKGLVRKEASRDLETSFRTPEEAPNPQSDNSAFRAYGTECLEKKESHMLNRKSIERALARAAGHQDESVVARLALFAPALLKAADLRAQLAAEAPEWTDEEIEAARLGKETLLSLRPVTIDSERFLQTVDAIAAVLLDNDEIEGDMLEACRAVDWTRFASDELLEIAGRDPMGYLHAVEVHAGEDDLLDIFLLPVLGLALRVFLDEAADEGSRRIARTGTDTTHHNRLLHCPVCGSDAAVASVTDTPLNGHVKQLWCTCCGAHWVFERIRCAVCGDQAVSDLSYIHDETDETRRLHVCAGCHAAFPTIFAGEELNFCADVEQIVMTGLELFYQNAVEGKEA